MEKKSKVGKVLGIIGYVVFGVFILLAVFLVIISIGAKKADDGAATIFGYQFRTVLTESMEENERTDVSGFKIKSLKKDSLVIVDCAPDPAKEEKSHEWYSKLKVGDVLTFYYRELSKTVPITHRITKIVELENGGYYIELKGDNDPDSVPQVIKDTSNYAGNLDYVIGKVVGSSYTFGVVITSLQSKIAIVLAIIVPCVIIIVFEAIKITRILGQDKRDKLIEEKKQKEDEMKSQEDEIARLKEQLEKLQKENTQSGENTENSKKGD